MQKEINWSNRIERLLLIEKLFLKQHQKLRTAEIAEKFGISDDTALRDLYFLSSTADTAAHNFKGEILDRLGRFYEAEQEYKKAQQSTM